MLNLKITLDKVANVGYNIAGTKFYSLYRQAYFIGLNTPNCLPI